MWSDIDHIICIELSGTIIHGKGLGNSMLHFPTANIVNITANEKCVAPGVYGGYATIEGVEGTYITYTSIGINPHFGEKQIVIVYNIIRSRILRENLRSYYTERRYFFNYMSISD